MAQLHSLRDEIRVRIHLGARELKEAWINLEMYAADVEAEAERAGPEKLPVLRALLPQWEALRRQLC